MRLSLASWCLVVGLAGMLPYALRRLEWTSAREVKIYIADVGQGDGIIVEFPDQQTWLVDAAGRWGKTSAFSQVLLPELATLGKMRLENIIITHPDMDHAYGVLGALKDWKVAKITSHAHFLKSSEPPLLKEIVELAEHKKVPLEWLKDPTVYKKGGSVVRIFPVSVGAKTNNNVLITEIEFQGCRAILMGDAEQQSETEFKSLSLESVDLLKVAHHGSKTSSHESFLNWANPQYSVISVGRNNFYGHPHRIVIHRLRGKTPTLLRTDRHGYVLFTFTSQGTVHCQSASGFCGESVCRKNQNRIENVKNEIASQSH